MKKSKSQSEVSVKEAGEILKVSDRSILNFIKTKRIQAIKVGRDWFIDYASIVAFAKRYDYPLSHLESENTDENNNSPKRNSKSESKEEKKVNIAQPLDPAADFDSNTEQHSKNEGQEEGVTEKGLYTNGKPTQSVVKLRVYELSRQLLTGPRFSQTPQNSIEQRVKQLGDEVLEELGAGFYAYGFEAKCVHYAKSRSRLGAMIALLRSRSEVFEDWQGEVKEIEVKLLPAFGALIRKLESRGKPKEVS